MKTKNQSPFQGEWVVCRTQYKNHKNKWITQKRFRFGNCVWSFRVEDEQGVYQGTMEESGPESENGSQKYAVSNGELYIDRSDYAEDGFLDTCRNDIYRFDPRKNKLILYDLSETGGDPDEYLFRIVLKRNTPLNKLFGKLNVRPSRKY